MRTMIFWTLLFTSLTGFQYICCGHLYARTSEIELGNVFNNSEYLCTFTGANAGSCAIRCENEGAACKSFNVKKNGLSGESTCELFGTRAVNITDMVQENGGRFFEKLCDSLIVIGSAKDEVSGQPVITLIDENMDVYQHTQIRKPNYLGSVFEVFDGYQGEVHDLFVAPVHGEKLYFIREGEIVYCFLGDATLERFSECPRYYPFPAPVISFIGNKGNDLTGLSMAMLREANLGIMLWSEGLEIVHLEVKNTEFNILHTDTIRCGVTPDVVGFCSWEKLWKAASAGVFLGTRKVCLFAKAICYIFDLDAKIAVERYHVCKDEINSFLLV